MIESSKIFLRIGGIIMKNAVNKLAKKNVFGVMNCLALLFVVLSYHMFCN